MTDDSNLPLKTSCFAAGPAAILGLVGGILIAAGCTADNEHGDDICMGGIIAISVAGLLIIIPTVCTLTCYGGFRLRSYLQNKDGGELELEERVETYRMEVKTKELPVRQQAEILSVGRTPYTDIALGDEIGGGGFGVVYKARWHGADVAVKQMRVTKMTASTTAAFVEEAEMMAQLRHPHVVQYFAFCDEVGRYSIVMEFMDAGSLYEVLHSVRLLDQQTQLQIAYDIGSGLAYLHGQNIIHRDLKSPNVLLDRELRAKLTDFGLSELKEETKTTTQVLPLVGSLSWMAPELFGLKPHFTKASDLFAYGIILWEIIARKRPYQGAAQSEISIRVVKGEREEIPKGSCSSSYAKIVRGCWHKRADKRPSAQEVMTSLESEGASLAVERAGQYAPSAPPASTAFFQPAAEAAPSAPPPGTLTQIVIRAS